MHYNCIFFGGFLPFFKENPEVVVRSEPFCPPCAIPVWVSVWVKNVVPEWVNQNGGFPCRFKTGITCKTTSSSVFSECMLTRFESGYSLPVFEPPVRAAVFSSARSLPIQHQYGASV